MFALRSLVLVLLVALVSACAQPARVSQMTVGNITGAQLADHPGLIGTLAVSSIAGGESTNPMWKSNVGNPEFTSALNQSLQANGLLAETPDTAIYSMTATLVELDQPFMGFNMTVTSKVAYRVTDKANDTAVFEKTISAPYTANMSSAFSGVERLRLANEGSVKRNIQLFLEQFVQAWAALPQAPALDAAARAAEPATSSTVPAPVSGSNTQSKS